MPFRELLDAGVDLAGRGWATLRDREAVLMDRLVRDWERLSGRRARDVDAALASAVFKVGEAARLDGKRGEPSPAVFPAAGNAGNQSGEVAVPSGLTTKEASALLNLSARQVRNLRRQGILTGVIVGGRLVFDREEVQSVAAQRGAA